tara:strand:+ start:1760 stop:2197 length:438 start_codon:yes stop_codon:yes gene_type:complete
MWRNHLVICGLDRVALCAAEHISERFNGIKKILVLDRDPAKAELAQTLGFSFILGDANSSNSLRVAQVTAAAAVFVCIEDTAALPIIRRIQKAASQTPIIAVLKHKANENAALRSGASGVLVLSEITGRLLADSVPGSRRSDRLC